MVHTMRKDHGGEGKPEHHTHLMERRASEVLVSSVFKNPNNKANEYEKTEACEPKLPCQRLQENPSILADMIINRNNH